MCLCVRVCQCISKISLSQKSPLQIHLFIALMIVLNKVISLQRPTAKDLLKHSFILKAKKTSFLVDLIDRYKRWKADHGAENDSDNDDSM